jgi:hypothetical protein
MVRIKRERWVHHKSILFSISLDQNIIVKKTVYCVFL